MSDDNEQTEMRPAKRQKVNDDEKPSSSQERELDESDNAEHTENQDFTCDNDKYNNFVTAEELEKLREFKVLDEVKSNDEDSNEDESDSSDGKSEGIPEEEIEKMLEEDLPEDFKGAPKPKEKTYITRQKIVLEEKVVNQFEVLPLDWMMVRHYSGMPIYMHRSSRVCTLSKPYFLGKGNTRRHEIPISAIPCYAYRRALEEEEKQKEIDMKIAEQIRNMNNANNAANNDNQNTENNEDNRNEIENDNGNNNGNNNGDHNGNINGNNNNINVDNNVLNEINNSNVNRNTNGNNNVVNTDNNDNVETNNDNENEGNPVNENRTEDVQQAENAEKEVNEDEKTEESSENNENDNKGKCPFSHGDSESVPQPEEIPLSRQPVVLPGGIVMPPPKVETVSTSWKSQHLTHEQVNDYCKKLFKFKTVNIMLFKRWADRRKYTKVRKALQYPTLPEGTKLITIPAQPNIGPENGGTKTMKRDWVMNMDGRSYLSVFHEYVRRALQKQPVYEFKQLENAATPYQATVYIGGMQYGVGHGSSKRQAKSAAARASVHILIPEMKDQLDAHMGHAPAPTNEPDFTFFDYVGIEDPRIAEFCAAACEPSPHAILRTCLLRNFGAADWNIHTEMKKLEYQKIELTMKVGKHSATVVCKNKKTAKQRASQSILQALHPHVRSWGSLLRMYGLRSVKSCKEKKIEEQEITLLQDKARQNEPNYAVLEKLRSEMRKLRERDAAVVPIGTLLLPHALPTHSASNLNNIHL